MASSKAIISAARDNDLRERAIALAAEGRFDKNPQHFVESNFIQLASAPINGNGDTVASMYEYAQVQYETKKKELAQKLAELEEKRPGADPASVTDEHLKYALDSLVKKDASVEGGSGI